MIERRFAELRAAEGRRLVGTAVRYGDVARVPVYGSERIQPGAFGDLSEADVILTRGHDRARPLARTGEGGGLQLTDTAEALTVRAELPPTRDATDTLELVRARVLRGLSVEMKVQRESRQADVRVVEQAKLITLGVVDRPAYPASDVAARAIAYVQAPDGKWIDVRLTGRTPTKKKLPCRCRDGTVDHVSIMPGAYAEAIREATEGERQIHAFLSGAYESPIASVAAKTLTIRETADALEIAISRLPATDAVLAFLAARDEAFFAIRPYFPDPAPGTVSTQEGAVRTYSKADLRAIEIALLSGPTAGFEAIDLVFGERPRRRRWRTWL